MKPIKVSRESVRDMEARLRWRKRERQQRTAMEQGERPHSTVGVYTQTSLPQVPASLARGVKVIDSRGSHVVALAMDGVFLGLFRR